MLDDPPRTSILQADTSGHKDHCYMSSTARGPPSCGCGTRALGTKQYAEFVDLALFERFNLKLAILFIVNTC